MYKTLKCAGQTMDAIRREHPLLQTWKAMNSDRERGTNSPSVIMHTSNNSNNNKRNI